MITRPGVGIRARLSSVPRMSPARPDETEEQRADRNWIDLLQELRVIQTGVQLLAGFLATIPFQARFSELDGFQRGWYVGLLCLAFATVGVTLTPVAIHRHVFQADAKPELVQAGHRLTATALVMIGVLLGGILFLVVDMVYDRKAAAGGGAAAIAVLAALLLVVPTRVAKGKDRP